MSKRELLFVWLAATSTVGCTPYVYRHSQMMAATGAVEFIDTAIVRGNSRGAYALLASDARGAMSFERFEAAMDQIRSNGVPTSVVAVEYQALPGQPAMNIYLNVSAPAEN